MQHVQVCARVLWFANRRAASWQKQGPLTEQVQYCALYMRMQLKSGNVNPDAFESRQAWVRYAVPVTMRALSCPAPTRSRADKSMSAHPGQCGCTGLGLLCGLRCGLLRRLLLRQLRRLLLLLLRTRTAPPARQPRQRRHMPHAPGPTVAAEQHQCCVFHAR